MIDFLILGAQKAATSALQEALRQHPEVLMPPGESAFFEDPDHAARPWESYGAGAPQSRIGIKRPNYLCSPQAIERIAAALPQARFIIVLRAPVSRAVSSYCYLVRHAHLPALPLNAGLERCLEAHEAGRGDRAATVISDGLYGRYLARWIAAYGGDAAARARFLVMSQSLVSTAPEQAVARSLAHLGLAPGTAMEAGAGIGRSNEGLYDPQMLKIARLGSLLKTRRLPGTERRVPRALPLRAAGVLVSRYAEARARARGQQRETLDPALRARLEALYAADLPPLRALVPPEVIDWAPEAGGAPARETAGATAPGREG